MMKNIIYRIQVIIFTFFTMVMASSCSEDTYDLGEIVKPTNLRVDLDIVGKDAANPHGDGSGVVVVDIHADNAMSYRIIRPSGAEVLAPGGHAVLNFSSLGVNTYNLIAVAYGVGGVSDSLNFSVEVLATYNPPADLLEKLVGNGSKTWRIKAEKPGHFGLGPVGGNIPTEWYGAQAFEKEGAGMYDDRYTFNIDGTYHHETNGTVFGRVGLIDEIGSGGTIVGADVLNMPYPSYSAEYSLIAPGGVETIELSGTAFIGYYTGGNHQYRIFDRTKPNELLLSTTDGNGEFEWWFILTNDDDVAMDCEDGYTGNQAGTGSYQLIWEDNFDEDGAPCAANWTYDIGGGGWGNQEAQYYTDRAENVKIENGILKIMAKRENFQGANFTSARLKTKGRMEFTHGKVEIKAKLPTQGGSWAALWTLGANIDQVGWPSCGEIDMMEHVGNNANNIINAIHNSAGSGGNAFVSNTNLSDVRQFHIYGIEWDENQIQFFVDGEVTFTYAPSPKTAANWPYNADQFLLMNIAVGGTLGGAIAADFNEAVMEVDYVRVYQK